MDKRRSSMEKKPSSSRQSSSSNSNRRGSEDKTSSSRRASEEKNAAHGGERKRSTEKPRRHDSAERPADNTTRKSKDDKDLTGSSSRRNSVEKVRPEKDGRKKSTSPRRFRGSSADRKPASKASTGEDGNKPARRRQRRPSVDDFAILEYEKRNRRQSNESSFSKKSKDDFDLGGGASKTKNGKKPRRKKSMDAFSRYRPKDKADKEADISNDKSCKSPKQSSSGGRASSTERRPKRRSLDSKTSSASFRAPTQQQPSDSRRTSVDSSHQPSHASSGSRRPGHNLRESLSSFGSDGEGKAKEKAKDKATPSRPIARRSSDNSMSQSSSSLTRLKRRSSDNSMSQSFSVGKTNQHRLQRRSSDNSMSKSFSVGRPNLQRRSSENSMTNSFSSGRPKLQRRNSDTSLIEASNKKRPSLDSTISGSFKVPSKVTSKVTESMVVMSEGKYARRNSATENNAIPKSLDTDRLEKFKEEIILSPGNEGKDHAEDDGSNAHDDNDHDRRSRRRRRHTEKMGKRKLPSRRDVKRSMSMKHVRSRSKEIKLRAFRRMSSSMSDNDIKVEKDKDDTLQQDNEEAYNRHGSDGELAKRKSSKRRDRMDKEKSGKTSSRSRDMKRRMSIKHVRSRSREIKLRAFRRMGSSSDDDDVKADKDDNDDGGLLSPEEAYNRQHGRSDGELAKRKSSKRRDSMDKEKSGKTSSRHSHRRPSLLIKKQSSHHTSNRSSQGKHRRESSTAQKMKTESSELGQVVGATTVSSHDLGEGEHKTEPGQPTSELDSYLAKKNNESRRSSRGSTRRSISKDKDSDLPHESSYDSLPRVKKSFYRRHKWKCLCCCTLLTLMTVAVVVAMIVLQAFDGGVSISVSMDGGIGTSVGVSDKGKGDGTGDASKDTPTDKPTPVDVLSTGMPSAEPSRVPTPPATTATPTPAPLADVTIAVIVQLDEKPEETGFSLLSADNSTTYVSKPIGSLAGRQSEVVMEVITIPEKTELVFQLTDTSGDLCCDHGNGYYRILAGTGDKKITVISGERSAKYVYTVGKKHAVQIGGVDSNEYCKPCPGNGQDCGRCAWCNAANGFLPDTIYSWQCRTNEISVPPKCFVGPKRVQLHDQYVAAMAGCTNGFEAWPRIDGDTSAAVDTTVCVQEAKCIKSFAFVEPDCNQELAGSLLAKETCQDKIGGVAFGYSFGLNAPRERDCPSSGEFATSLALRCCSDGVAYCSTFLEDGPSAMEDEKMPPTPVPAGTHEPTISNAPTWDGYPITLLIQLDDYPQETGFSITSMMQGQNVTFLERRPGYYKKSQLLVEKVQMPEGIDAVLTLTDQEGDGICCENGVGYFQVYSEEGSLILDEAGGFGSSVSQTFFVGDPKTLPPTGSAAPSESSAPTFDLFPITIAVQMDQWSDEVGLSIQSSLVGDGDGSHTFFDWPAGTFSGQASGLVVETVLLPRDIQATLRVTDTGGDGFCCLYGDGYIKIFAGESADDESDIIASESAEFEFEKVVAFQAGPAPSLAPATTPIPTISKTTTASTGPTSSSQPTVDAILVTIVLQLDKYSAETAWFIDSSDGLTNFIARPVGYYEGMESQKIIESVHLPEGLEYQFRILDFMGDGTCCWAGKGWYSLYEGDDIKDDSTQVFYGNGDFGRERAHIFVAGKAKTPAPTSSRVPSGFPSPFPTMAPSLSLKPSVTKYLVEIQIKLDNHSSQTGWSITSADESTVITDRLPGYFSGNDTMTVVETIRLVAGEYKFTVLDSNGDGFCCQQGLGYYSLYANGQLLLFRQGEFEDSYSETFAIGFSLPVNDDLTVKSNSDPMLRGSIPSSYNPKRQRKHFGQKP